MEYIYAAMLLHKAGKKVEEGTMEKVLSATGVTVDKARVKATVAALKDVDIDKVIKEASIVTSAPATTVTTKPEAAKAEKKEEAKVSDEEAAAGLGALFG